MLSTTLGPSSISYHSSVFFTFVHYFSLLFGTSEKATQKSRMAICGSLLVLLVFSCFATSSHGVTFSSLQRTLTVTTTPSKEQVLKAGEDIITVRWSYNSTFPRGTDSDYKKIQVKLCYAPISQVDRAWRRTEGELDKDKTCQFTIVTRPYSRSNNTFTWTIERDIPTATYFVRAYAHNSHDEVVAFGQSTDAQKTTNLFQVQAISGRHASLDIASACFSAFSVVSLFGFFFWEKRKAKASQQK